MAAASACTTAAWVPQNVLVRFPGSDAPRLQVADSTRLCATALTASFARALRRDDAERFGNAGEMLREWRHAFAPMDCRAAAPEGIEVAARRLHPASSIAEVGYGLEARAVLDRMGIHTVHHLPGVPRQQFRGGRRLGTQPLRPRCPARPWNWKPPSVRPGSTPVPLRIPCWSP